MAEFNFKISYIVPFTHKMIPIQFMYDYQIIHDYLVMPWETGLAKSIEFRTSLVDNQFEIEKFKIINSLNKMPILIESITLDNIPQNISSHLPQHQKHVYFDTFFKACNIDVNVFKITDLPHSVLLSHSYVCNGNLYVAQSDRSNSILTFNQGINDFKFVIECFHSKIIDCLYKIECHFESSTIHTKVLRPNPKNISELHKYLKNHFEEIEDTIIEEHNHDNNDYKKIA